jgi:hypothetical protein
MQTILSALSVYHSLKGCSGSLTTWPPRTNPLEMGLQCHQSVCMAFGPRPGAPHRPGAGVTPALRHGGRGQVLGVYHNLTAHGLAGVRYANLRVSSDGHVWKPVLSDRNICTRTKLHVVQHIYQAGTLRGMELVGWRWRRNTSTEAFARPGVVARILRGALAHRRHGQAAHCRSAYCRRTPVSRTFADDAIAAALPAQPGFGWEGIAVVQAVLIMSRSVAQTAPAQLGKTWWGRMDISMRCKSRQACFLHESWLTVKSRDVRAKNSTYF